jgi:hypothetical protein
MPNEEMCKSSTDTVREIKSRTSHIARMSRLNTRLVGKPYENKIIIENWT